MKFKITVRQVVKPYKTESFTCEAHNRHMAKTLFIFLNPQYDKPEFHIIVEKCKNKNPICGPCLAKVQLGLLSGFESCEHRRFKGV